MNQTLLEMKGISKAFPGVQALDDVSITIDRGEVHGLLGENGAGKSTLMKILSGVYKRDMGEIILEGEPIDVHNPHHAQMLGITIIHQELNLMSNLTVAENVYIGREPNRFSFVRWGELHQKTREITDRLGVDISPTARVGNLSVAEKQMVEIARALSVESRVIIMDEPTSALTDNEVEHLFNTVRELKAQGLGIIFITHRMEEVFAICDRVSVLRDGAYVGTVEAQESSPDEIISMMVGRSVSEYFGYVAGEPGDVVLEVRDLNRVGTKEDPTAKVLTDINFKLRQGEVVGLAGLVGAGRTELARCIFGADRRNSGEIFVNGEPVSIRSPRDAIRLGIGMVPEDRKLQALFLALSVEHNMSMVALSDYSQYGFVQARQEREVTGSYVDQLNIRLARFEQQVLNLSGGNQQKVVIARWLALKPKILIMDEPTRGIDVGAKAEVHTLIHELAQAGVAVLMISSELPEVLAMSDRILVMHESRLMGELTREEATPERVGTLMTGNQSAVKSEPV